MPADPFRPKCCSECYNPKEDKKNKCSALSPVKRKHQSLSTELRICETCVCVVLLENRAPGSLCISTRYCCSVLAWMKNLVWSSEWELNVTAGLKDPAVKNFAGRVCFTSLVSHILATRFHIVVVVSYILCCWWWCEVVWSHKRVM